MLKWITGKIKNMGTGTLDTTKKLTQYDTTKKFAGETIDLAKHVFNPKNTISKARVETFAEAQARHNVSDDEILQIYRNYSLMAILSFIVMIGLNITAFIRLATNDYPAAGVCFSFTFMFFALFFKFSFRAYQIRHHNLCAIERWVGSPKEWIPNPFV